MDSDIFSSIIMTLEFESENLGLTQMGIESKKEGVLYIYMYTYIYTEVKWSRSVVSNSLRYGGL